MTKEATSSVLREAIILGSAFGAATNAPGIKSVSKSCQYSP
ncbi:hypothetical protein D018_2745A, partial [Vibrio parahaemolyticus VP2007-007]